uniref:Integrase catalytic domain-containing protein n=1 Tax=Oryzias latipes TaxID=8090 RepID=A0A3P9JKY0_ORYLA
MTDHFTKYAVAVPTPNQKARTVAKCLWENFFTHSGIPAKLHSDQGTDFESKTIRKLCGLAGIQKIRTTPYHPRGNPVERFNRTLLDMLGTLSEQEKKHWKDYVKPLVHAYNCTKNDVTGFSPYELMFGRQPRLPIDLAFGLPLKEDRSPSYREYVQKLTSHLEENRRAAIINAAKAMKKNKERFDRHVIAADLDVGERVLVRNVRQRGKHKLADKWEQSVYIVVSKAGHLPVYTVRPEHCDKPLRTLHRDLLLPCAFSSIPPGDPVSRKKPMKDDSSPVLPTPPTATDSSVDEDEQVYVPSPAEPVSFTSTFVLPAVRQPDPATQCATPLPAPPAVTTAADVDDNEKGETQEDTIPHRELVGAVESSPASVTSDASGGPEAVSATTPKTPGPVQNEAGPASSVESVPVSADPPQLREEPTSPSESHSLEEPQVRRGQRVRTQPVRLQYQKPGRPLLQSIQTVLHGLSSAFFFALQDDEQP